MERITFYKKGEKEPGIQRNPGGILLRGSASFRGPPFKFLAPPVFSSERKLRLVNIVSGGRRNRGVLCSWTNSIGGTKGEFFLSFFFLQNGEKKMGETLMSRDTIILLF